MPIRLKLGDRIVAVVPAEKQFHVFIESEDGQIRREIVPFTEPGNREVCDTALRVLFDAGQAINRQLTTAMTVYLYAQTPTEAA